jgi:hypothetical protein
MEARTSHQQNGGGGLILCTALPAQWAVCQPRQMEVLSQGIVTGKESGDHPGLSPTKGRKHVAGAPSGPGDQLSILSLRSPKIPSSSPVLVFHPAINLCPRILSRDPQGRLRTHKIGGRAVSREPIGSLVASHPCMPGNPLESHGDSMRYSPTPPETGKTVEMF